MSFTNKIRNFLFLGNFTLALIFFFLLSTQVALTNTIYENYKSNICGNEDKSSSLSCQSHCILSQLDNTTSCETSSPLFVYKIQDTSQKLVNFNLNPLIEAKSNSPPVII